MPVKIVNSKRFERYVSIACKIESSYSVIRIYCSHHTYDSSERTTTFKAREHAGRELKQPENFTHCKLPSINYETYTDRAAVRQNKKKKIKE